MSLISDYCWGYISADETITPKNTCNMIVDTDYILETLKKLVRIDSVLPHEEKLAGFLADEIRSFGIEPELHEVAPGRPNVYAIAELGSSESFLVFSGHSDTVDAASDWETNPFEPVVKDGRLYGLGAINMKSGLACMLAAFKALIESKEYRGRLGRLGLAVTVDQEGYSLGAKALLGTYYGRCDAMLHAEHFFGSSEKDYLPMAVTGKILYKLIVHGRAAHAFRPHEGGINAVTDASRIITALDKLKLKKHPIFEQGTVCVLKVDGGYKEYSIVVPERCEIVITRLTVPGETAETARQDMLDLIASLKLESKVDIEMAPPSYEPYSLDLQSEPATTFSAAYQKVIGHAPHFGAHRGIVDANVFAGEGGIPTIVFGPKGAGHHKAGEYVEIQSLAPVARVYAEAAISYLSKKS